MKELNKKFNAVNCKIAILTILLAIGLLLIMFGIGDISYFVDVNGEYIEELEASNPGFTYFAYGDLCFPLFCGIVLTLFCVIGIVNAAKDRAEVVAEMEKQYKVLAPVLEVIPQTIDCPQCKAKISRNETDETITCPDCGAVYKNPYYKN